MDANEVAWTYRDHHPLSPTPPPTRAPRGGELVTTLWDGGQLTTWHETAAAGRYWFERRRAWHCEISVVTTRAQADALEPT